MRTINLIKFTLHEYYRATGFMSEVLTVAFFLLLFNDQYWLLKAFDVYLGLGLFAIISTFLTTYRIVGRETNQRIYVILTKHISRREYLAAKLASVFAVSAVLISVLFLLGFYLCKIRYQFSFPEAVLRLLPIYLVALLTAVITLYFLKLVYDNIVAAFVLIILSFAQPPGLLNYILPPAQQLIKTSFNDFELYKLAYIFWGCVYILLFFNGAVKVFERRELNFDKD